MNQQNSTSPITPANDKPAAKPAPARGSLSRLLSMGQFPLAILITLGVLAYLLWPESPTAEEAAVAPEAETVRLDLVLHRLAITAGTPLEKKLVVAPVVPQETSAPKLKVNGAVVARVPPSPPAPLPKGEGSKSPAPPALHPPVARDSKGEESKSPAPPAAPAKGEGRTAPSPPAPLPEGEGSKWDFNTSELASAYSDWLKARADVPFYEKQLEDIQKLAAETLKAKKDVADRLEKLVKAGTDPEKDLAAAKADYLQAMAQSQKDEHEAQTNLKNAKRTLATLERQLFQAGMDPDLLANPVKSTAIVVAEVPEGRIGLVEKGQDCVAQFSALPGDLISGSVRSLSPTISKERRTLRVFFQLSDPQGRLKPGMFAEIGLGTDLRKTLRIAADGVLHVGQSDYVLVETKRGDWKITKIITGEQYGSQIEVLAGLQSGDRVIGSGAILLKPYVVQDVQARVDAAAAATAVSGGSAGR